jgi:hypothetical protein
MGESMNDPLGEKDSRPYVEIELGNKKRKIFLYLYPYESEIWVDIKALPPSAFLCACCDGTPLMQFKKVRKKEMVTCISIDWIINEWGGHKEIVEAIIKRKSMILADLDKYKKMVDESP